MTKTSRILEDRLAILDSLILTHGAHAAFEKGVCAMEAVSWLAGEPHSDAPRCACPVIASFARRLNDRIPTDEMRTQIMRPILPLIVGTRSSRDVMVKRAYIAADFAVREMAPAALDARGRKEDAARLRSLAPIVDRETAIMAQKAAAAGAAAYAYATAYATAAAADAAAATAYADADADAAYAATATAAAAAYAATAYAATADAADAREPIYRAAAERLRRMCECR